MEKGYSVEFFASILKDFHAQCKAYFNFQQIIEVSGYVCVEIDNQRRERYVLSELIQTNGEVVSESYCTKVLNIPLKLEARQKACDMNTNIASKEYEEDKQLLSRNKLITEDSSKINESSFGLKISCVSSLRNSSEPNEPDKDVVEIESEENDACTPEAFLKSCHVFPESTKSQEQLLQDAWEGRDTFVFDRDPQIQESMTSIVEKASSGYKALWHQPAGTCSTKPEQKIDKQRLNPGSIMTGKTSGLSDSKDLRRNDDGRASFTSGAESDNDLAVLNNEYFTAQILAHTGHVMDPKVFQESEAQSSCLPDHKEPGTSGAPQISVRNMYCSQPVSQDSENLEDSSQGNSSSVCVIDEDSDDIIDVDMDASSDDESSQQTSQDLSRKSTFNERLVLTEEEKQRKRYRSSLKYQRYAVKLFNNFQKSKGEGIRPIQTMHPEKLDELLSEFYPSLKKTNGEEFGSVSLRNVQSHLESYLRDASYPFSITKAEQFARSRQILRNKILELRAKSRPLPGKLAPITESDIRLLFDVGELGGDNPDSLLNTMWFMNNMFFQVKHNADQYGLLWGDIHLYRTEQGRDVLQCLVGRSKGQKIYSNTDDPEHCYVRLYIKYRDKRPAHTLTDTAPFYLSPCRVFVSTNSWFMQDHASMHRLKGIFKKMAAAAGLESKRMP